MKKVVFIQILMCMSLVAMAQKVQRVLAPGQDSVKFTTRRDLAPGQYAYRLDSIVNVASYGKSVFRFAYDEQGRILEMIRHFSYDLNPYKSIYHYDERGFCVREDQYEMTYGKDVLTMVREATYTDEGRLLKKESKWYGEDCKLYRINTVRNTYNQRGNLVEQMDEYKMQRSESVSKSKTTYAYNALNQQIEEIAYGHKVQEDEFFPNITTTREYDQNGRVSHYPNDWSGRRWYYRVLH